MKKHLRLFNIFILLPFFLQAEITETTPNCNNFSVSAKPSIPFTCAGGMVKITATCTGGTPGYKYNWSNVNSTDSAVNVGPSINTTYTVTASDAGGCSATAASTIMAYPFPVLSITQQLSECKGSSLQLAIAAGVGTAPYVYTWSPATGLNNTGISNPVANLEQTTSYNITVTDAHGCTASGQQLVNVRPVPVVTVSPENPTVCTGSKVNLQASVKSGTPPFIYGWSNGLGNGSGAELHPSSKSNYGLTVTDGAGCSATSGTTVSVSPLPLASITPAKLSICSGANANLTALAKGGRAPYSYSWGKAGNSKDINVTPTETALYTLVITDTVGCSASAQIAINVEPLLSVTIFPADATICPGRITILTANPTGGNPPLSYKWSNAGGATPKVNVHPAVSTVYSVTVADMQYLHCSATASANVFILDSAKAPTAVKASANGLKAGSPVTLSFTDGTLGANNPHETWKWYEGKSCCATAAGSGPSITVKPTETTTYYVRAEGGCNVTKHLSVKVDVTAAPAAVKTGEKTKEDLVKDKFKTSSKELDKTDNQKRTQTAVTVEKKEKVPSATNPPAKNDVAPVAKATEVIKHDTVAAVKKPDMEIPAKKADNVTIVKKADTIATVKKPDTLAVAKKPDTVPVVVAPVVERDVFENKMIAAGTLYKLLKEYSTAAALKPYYAPTATIATAAEYKLLFDSACQVIDEITPSRIGKSSSEFRPTSIEHYISDMVRDFPKGLLVSVTGASVDYSEIMRNAAVITIEKYVQGITPNTKGGTNLYKGRIVETLHVRLGKNFESAKIIRVTAVNGEVNCADCK